MNRSLIFSVIAILLFAFSSNSEIKLNYKYDNMINELENKTTGMSISIIKHKRFNLDLSSARKQADNVLKTNPILMKSTMPFVEKESDKEYIFKSNSIEYRLSKVANHEMLLDLSRYTVSEKTDLIDSAHAVRIASAYIGKNITDIQPDELRYSKTIKIVISGGACDELGNVKGQIHSEIANYIVMYDRNIDGIPVIGPGGKIRVYIARNGDVIGHSKLWKQIEKEDRNPNKILSPHEAHKKLTSDILLGNSAEVVPELQSIKFGYFEDGRNKKQDLLSPAYEFVYNYGAQSKKVIVYLDAYSGKKLNNHEYIQGDPR